MGVIWEKSLADFIIVTLVLGGGAAYLTGRAMAMTWRSMVVLIVYLALLTAAVRFIHFALFEGTLLSLHYYVVDLVILLFFGGLGFRVARTAQMTHQYRWLYQRSGPVFWHPRQS